jgi:hypothetical protein
VDALRALRYLCNESKLRYSRLISRVGFPHIITYKGDSSIKGEVKALLRVEVEEL